MHPAARQWVEQCVAKLDLEFPYSVLEFGSLDVNGSLRDLFPSADPYVGVDQVTGPGVDMVCDAARYSCTHLYPIVIATEVLEHARDWRGILDAMYRSLAPPPEGTMILTFGTTGRNSHGAWGNEHLQPDEWYHNVSLTEFAGWADGRFEDMDIQVTRERDLYFLGRR